jgi:hypothetical protein
VAVFRWTCFERESEQIMRVTRLDSLLNLDIELSAVQAMCRIEKRFLNAKLSLGLDTTIERAAVQYWQARDVDVSEAKRHAEYFAVSGTRSNAGEVMVRIDESYTPVRSLWAEIIRPCRDDVPSGCFAEVSKAMQELLLSPYVGVLEFEAILIYWGRGVATQSLLADYETQLLMKRLQSSSSVVSTTEGSKH